MPRVVTKDAANATVMAIAISSIILLPAAFKERLPAVQEDYCAQDGRDPGRAGERQGRVAHDVPDHGAEVDDRDGQGQGQPEPVLEHRRAVPGVLAVAVDGVVILAAVELVVGVRGLGDSGGRRGGRAVGGRARAPVRLCGRRGRRDAGCGLP
jgi:hypothetical protein